MANGVEIYIYPANSEMGACATYLGYFEKFADSAHKLIYITIEQIDRILEWADKVGPIQK